MITIKNLEEEEIRLFNNWAEKILTRDVPAQKKETVSNFLKDTRPEEVEDMITNLERVLKKSWKEAENKGIEKVAREMLLDGEPIEKIMKYTGLTKEEIEKLQ